MSKAIMAEIAAHSQAKGHRQLVLLRLAYYADNDGCNAYPSMLTIADQTGITERHVQRCIKALEAEGHIAVERQKEPGKNPRNIYTILRPWHTAHIHTQASCIVHNSPAQISTDIVSIVQDSLAQISTDMCTDMCTDHMSVDPKEEDPEEKKRARVRETEEKKQAITIRDEIRHQETFLSKRLGTPNGIGSVAAQHHITYLKGLLAGLGGGNNAQETCPQAAEAAREGVTSNAVDVTGVMQAYPC